MSISDYCQVDDCSLLKWNKSTNFCNKHRKQLRIHGYIKRTQPSLSRHPLYRTWLGMKRRCNNPNAVDYSYYGGRGIKVCNRWLESFENFLIDMGEKPDKKLSLDRVDNDGNYEPRNCRWATHSEQMLNRRDRISV